MDKGKPQNRRLGEQLKCRKKEKISMAQHIIRGTSSLSNSASRSPSLNLVVTLRLTLGLVATLGSLISFLGTSWDIQWHVFVGRDRTLIPPHEMMLTGITVSGIAALAVV